MPISKIEDIEDLDEEKSIKDIGEHILQEIIAEDTKRHFLKKICKQLVQILEKILG